MYTTGLIVHGYLYREIGELGLQEMAWPNSMRIWSDCGAFTP